MGQLLVFLLKGHLLLPRCCDQFLLLLLQLKLEVRFEPGSIELNFLADPDHETVFKLVSGKIQLRLKIVKLGLEFLNLFSFLRLSCFPFFCTR